MVGTPGSGREQRGRPAERLAEAYLGSQEGIEVVGREELAARLTRGEVLVLDVRPAAEYAAGHIAGARSVPVTELRRQLRAAPAARRRERGGLCRGPYCVYADEAVRELTRHGFRAQRLAGGTPGVEAGRAARGRRVMTRGGP